MVPEQWSVSRLACELAMDRRALGKRLEGLQPVSESKSAGGKRTERKYRLADVISHLANPDDEKLDLTHERAKLARLQQQKIGFEIEELRGSLIRIDAVIEHWRGKIAACRAKLLSLPSRLAAQVAAPSKLVEAQERAQALVYEALNELAGTGAPPDAKGKRASRETLQEVAP